MHLEAKNVTVLISDYPWCLNYKIGSPFKPNHDGPPHRFIEILKMLPLHFSELDYGYDLTTSLN